MFEQIKRLAVEEEGADATEYALLAALIAIGLIVGATALGNNLNNIFDRLGTRLSTVNP